MPDPEHVEPDEDLEPEDDRLRDRKGNPLGECRFCHDTERIGPNSTVCIACTLNPKKRDKHRQEQEES
jgi:hypothetical protein